LTKPGHTTNSECSATHSVECGPASCRWRCALEVIDELLSEPGAVSGDEMDRLLDLRYLLRRAEDAEGALRLFCDLRRRLEQRHYLAFFRLRRWLENRLVAEVRICPAAEPQRVRVKLGHYCVEALRRVSLCAALGEGSVLLAPRLRFVFSPASVPAPPAANVLAAHE
jgi:hypothetical protein